ncbi:MAG: endonuclease MutS2 [Chloroflexota bacterium]
MDTKSLELLEFDRAKALVARHASFELARRAIADLQPSNDRQVIEERLAECAEARRLLSLQPDFATGAITDIRPAVSLAAQGRVLEPWELLEIAATLEAVASARHRIEHVSDELPRLWAIGQALSDLTALAHAVTRGIGPAGEILDTASPRLMQIRRELVEARRELVSRLEQFIASPEGQHLVSDMVVTQREGRYVIPVKSEFRRDLQGIVHDVSNSGATVFIEPWSMIQPGNVLRELELEERTEIERLLQERSEALGAYGDEMAHDVEVMTRLEVAVAKARYAHEVKATEAALIDCADNYASPTLNIRNARHPLLGHDAIPLSLKMGGDLTVLVVTGPNTGGKTVLLKTVGLMIAMTQSGIPVPADVGTTLPVFDSVFADIGDEQSIEQTLSTFSWHVSNLVRIVSHSTNHSLVLLDEPGSATDPIEGSALARALLQHFRRKGTLTIAATHYTDVKVFAHTTEGLQNASLEFDPVTNKPTYRLQMGFPGGSNALATAARLGLPEELLDNARRMMPKAEQDLAALLADLEREKKEASTLRAELQEERTSLTEARRELDDELARLRTEERRAVSEARDNLVRDVASLHRQIREASAELRKTRSREQVDRARDTLGVARQRLEGPDMQPPPLEESTTVPVDDGRIHVGDTVRIRGTFTEGTVLSLSEKTYQVEIQCRQTRLWLGVDSLDKVAPSAKPDSPGISIKSEKVNRDISRELDLRGRRAEEVEPELDSYVNAATLARLPTVRIIHGAGTGTVRSIVREWAASTPLVTEFRPGERSEGGDGVTVLDLQ